MADVTLTLSNPIEAIYAKRLGLEDRDYKTHDEITVSQENARAIIGAGYAQVDPEDQQAVARALGLSAPKTDATASRTTEAEAAFLAEGTTPDPTKERRAFAPSVEPASGSGTAGPVAADGLPGAIGIPQQQTPAEPAEPQQSTPQSETDVQPDGQPAPDVPVEPQPESQPEPAAEPAVQPDATPTDTPDTTPEPGPAEPAPDTTAPAGDQAAEPAPEPAAEPAAQPEPAAEPTPEPAAAPRAAAKRAKRA